MGQATGGRGSARHGATIGRGSARHDARRRTRRDSRTRRNASRAHAVGGACRNAIHRRADGATDGATDGVTDGVTGGGEIRMATCRDPASGAQAQPSEAGIPLKGNPRS